MISPTFFPSFFPRPQPWPQALRCEAQLAAHLLPELRAVALEVLKIQHRLRSFLEKWLGNGWDMSISFHFNVYKCPISKNLAQQNEST